MALVHILLVALPVAACEAAPRQASNSNVVTDTIGDTVIVRTVTGSAWDGDAELVTDLSIGQGVDGPEQYLFGRIASLAVDDDGSIYVLDGQVQELRVFDAEGTYMATLARSGRGPGEIARAEAIALLPDRRLAVRDPGNSRVQVLGPGPNRSEEWRYQAANHMTHSSLWTDTKSRTYLIARDLSPSAKEREHVIVLGPQGEHLDTLATPDAEFAPAILEARRMMGRISSSTTRVVPFSPTLSWAVHPSGALLVGISTDYRIEVRLGDRVRRIERHYEALPVTQAERDYYREFIEHNMRNFQSDWTWEGPPIPETKPPFIAVHAGRDGRIWVERSAEPRVESELWRGEKLRYDVFEFDGTYLGAVDAPEDMAQHPPPVFGTDHVWAVARDELRVERVVRYRIEPKGEG